ncbi:MAG: hypothetical protein H6621_04565 [Halobacteriovoraceae bacterium]|nr:hypothetical protein [Halobacteriovoraceae bacterium]
MKFLFLIFLFIGILTSCSDTGKGGNKENVQDSEIDPLKNVYDYKHPVPNSLVDTCQESEKYLVARNPLYTNGNAGAMWCFIRADVAIKIDSIYFNFDPVEGFYRFSPHNTDREAQYDCEYKWAHGEIGKYNPTTIADHLEDTVFICGEELYQEYLETGVIPNCESPGYVTLNAEGSLVDLYLPCWAKKNN